MCFAGGHNTSVTGMLADSKQNSLLRHQHVKQADALKSTNLTSLRHGKKSKRLTLDSEFVAASSTGA